MVSFWAVQKTCSYFAEFFLRFFLWRNVVSQFFKFVGKFFSPKFSELKKKD
jgi:hypothetical protein